MSTTPVKPNPILDYTNIINSSDPIAIKIVASFNNIYNNYVTFCNTIDNPVDVSGLDNAATQIENNFNDITNLMLPCINDPTPFNVKCVNSNNCKWSSDVENISLEFVTLIAGMAPPIIPIKSQYTFVAFYMIIRFYDSIFANKANYNAAASTITDTYTLCANMTYRPKSTDPKLVAQYNLVKKRMQILQENKNTRQSDLASYNFLLYILLPTVIFIILMLLYVNHTKKIKNIPDAQPSPTTGGALYDTLNFISTIGMKFIRS